MRVGVCKCHLHEFSSRDPSARNNICMCTFYVSWHHTFCLVQPNTEVQQFSKLDNKQGSYGRLNRAMLAKKHKHIKPHPQALYMNNYVYLITQTYTLQCKIGSDRSVQINKTYVGSRPFDQYTLYQTPDSVYIGKEM